MFSIQQFGQVQALRIPVSLVFLRLRGKFHKIETLAKNQKPCSTLSCVHAACYTASLVLL